MEDLRLPAISTYLRVTGSALMLRLALLVALFGMATVPPGFMRVTGDRFFELVLCSSSARAISNDAGRHHHHDNADQQTSAPEMAPCIVVNLIASATDETVESPSSTVNGLDMPVGADAAEAHTARQNDARAPPASA